MIVQRILTSPLIVYVSHTSHKVQSNIAEPHSTSPWKITGSSAFYYPDPGLPGSADPGRIANLLTILENQDYRILVSRIAYSRIVVIMATILDSRIVKSVTIVCNQSQLYGTIYEHATIVLYYMRTFYMILRTNK